MSSMNKTKAVLQWLQTGAGISSMEATKNFGATRLSAIIFNLKRKGYDIETVTCEGTDRFGNKMQFARYYLRDSPLIAEKMCYNLKRDGSSIVYVLD